MYTSILQVLFEEIKAEFSVLVLLQQISEKLCGRPIKPSLLAIGTIYMKQVEQGH